ncbi:MAG TPA: RagB/SusD family nutrient uptake outer membrane protein [Prolixibacteraceae bacterium]|nr:RagB/SusD family nutrient uptake outer membrane protein [Prolixibacteraceae bacterium]
MKNIFKIYQKVLHKSIVPVLILGMAVTSCEKNIDLEPFNQVSETAAFKSPALIALTVTGMYQAAQLGFYDGAYRGYPFGAAFVQQGDNRGEDVVNVATFYQLTYTATYSPTTANNVHYWKDSYRLINRCNIVIEGVKKAATENVIPAALAAEYEGEARLLRAMTYHELLIHFARPFKDNPTAPSKGVPYFETPFTTQAAIDAGFATGRSTVAEVYAKILADLDFAETSLPLKAVRTGNFKLVRATKGAAVAEKTRIYLHMWDMDKVIAEGTKFTTGAMAGTYSLTADPSGPFVTPYANTESIFGMENSGTNNPGVNAALASQYGRRQLVCVSPIIWRNPSWLADDKRRADGAMTFKVSNVIFTNKYKDQTNYTDPSPMLRYAEVLLNMAEAYARKGDVANGLIYLNMVRNRALATPATQAYTAANFKDNVELLGAILVERRIEFVMEGRRWPDIHRLQQCPYFPINGIPAKLANGMPAGTAYTLGTPYTGALGTVAVPYSDFRFVWPIPQDEINANPTLAAQQNPGW